MDAGRGPQQAPHERVAFAPGVTAEPEVTALLCDATLATWRACLVASAVRSWVRRSFLRRGLTRTTAHSLCSVPLQVTCVELCADDHFLILASDGLWDVMSVQVCRCSGDGVGWAGQGGRACARVAARAASLAAMRTARGQRGWRTPLGCGAAHVTPLRAEPPPQEAAGLVYDTVKDPVMAGKRLVCEVGRCGVGWGLGSSWWSEQWAVGPGRTSCPPPLRQPRHIFTRTPYNCPALCPHRARQALMRGSADNVTAAVAFLTPLGTLERVFSAAEGERFAVTGTAYGSRVRMAQDRVRRDATDEVRDTY
jgi:hypothetical protein